MTADLDTNGDLLYCPHGLVYADERCPRCAGRNLRLWEDEPPQDQLRKSQISPDDPWPEDFF